MASEDRICCFPQGPKLEERPLMSQQQAVGLETTFKTLANRTRLRLLHALVRAGELCVTELAETLGMKHSAVSNQLQRLADRGIVDSRRNGLQVYYRILDPCTRGLLDYACCVTKCCSIRASETPQSERPLA